MAVEIYEVGDERIDIDALLSTGEDATHFLRLYREKEDDDHGEWWCLASGGADWNAWVKLAEGILELNARRKLRAHMTETYG